MQKESFLNTKIVRKSWFIKSVNLKCYFYFYDKIIVNWITHYYFYFYDKIIVNLDTRNDF